MGFRAAFGPGLSWTAAAIGVSHLVQSTRAGADAGLGLAGVILLAPILMYPFFEYGPRYAAATGTSLVEGYRRIGRWALWLYFLITLTTSLAIQSAIVLFTAFLLNYALGLDWPLPVTGAAIVLGCGAMLWIGRFPWLDRVVKVILVLLAASTVAAAAVVVGRFDASTLAFLPPVGAAEGAVPFAFLLTLVGWMPSAIAIAVWSSLWTLAKNAAAGGRVSVAMLGAWMRPVVLVAVLTTMLSTVITVVDGFPRAIERTLCNLRSSHVETAEPPSAGPLYWGALLALGVATVLVLWLFAGTLTALVDFATIVSFLTAPILGYLNLRAVRAPEVPLQDRPTARMVALAWVGLVFLGGTAPVYLASLVR